MILDINIYHVKILHRLDSKGGYLPYNKMSICIKGIIYYIKQVNKYVQDLQSIKAIIIKDNYRLFEITEKGKIILQNNKNFLNISRRTLKQKKYDLDTSLTLMQKKIMHLIKKYVALNELDKIQACNLCHELNIGRAAVSRQFSEIKKKGYITFEPYRPYTIKILKDIE